MNVPRFKINVLKTNKISDIIVFYGYHEDIDSLTRLFLSTPRDPSFIGIFTEEELEKKEK